MNSRLTLQDLAGLLAKRTGRKKKESEEFLRIFISTVSEGVFTDKIVKVNGLGTFKIIKVEDRESIHVNTGERFVIPGHYKFNFLPDKELKELVNKPFSFFDTTEIKNEEEILETKTVEPIDIILPTQKEEIEIEPELQNEERDFVEASLPEKRKKKKRDSVLTVLIFLVVLLSILFTYLYYSNYLQKRNIESSSIVEKLPNTHTDNIIVTEVEPATAIEEDIHNASNIADQKEEETTPKSEVIAHVIIKPGSLLTEIALEHYGNKVFWVYIYEYNKEKINNPNNVPIGTELAIPAPELYTIDAKNSESVRIASLKQTEIINSRK